MAIKSDICICDVCKERVAKNVCAVCKRDLCTQCTPEAIGLYMGSYGYASTLRKPCCGPCVGKINQKRDLFDKEFEKDIIDKIITHIREKLLIQAL